MKVRKERGEKNSNDDDDDGKLLKKKGTKGNAIVVARRCRDGWAFG
jgi:hypothetical protein